MTSDGITSRLFVRIGVDLGGTKIEVVALADDGRELVRRRRPTPSGDYRATIAAIVIMVHDIERELGERGSVGVGTPGAISPRSGLIKNSNSQALMGQPLDRDLAAALNRPVRMANDANCFALSEAVDGAAAGAEIVFGVILGTGVGGGIVVSGHVLTGANAISGEWGHNPLPWPRDDERPGPACYCGRHGCIEVFLSGPAMASGFAAATGRAGLTASDIVKAAAGDDRDAETALQRYEERLARALAHIINIIDPHVIVLGGGMSNLSRLYVNVPPLWRDYVFSDTIDTKLVPPRHGDSSGVRGAAWLWPLGQGTT
ncbi:MAG: ROK family protein [Alphaproteobacteria bacterium]|nr:ROK family protein [Alphaproteobacteria bacterium]